MTRTLQLLVPVTALLALAAGCSAPGPSSKEVAQLIENHTEQAQQYLNMGELDRGEGQTQKGLELDPDNVKLRVIRAMIRIKRGRPEDVLLAEQILRDIDDADYQVHLCLGLALERKGLAYDEAAVAIESGQRVTEAADPKARVVELREQSQAAWREAVTSFETALEEHAEDTDAMNGLLRVHGLLGEKEKSLRWAEKLIATTDIDLGFWRKQMLRPDMSADEEARFRGFVNQYSALQGKTHMAASVLLHDLGRYAEAETHVTSAIEIDPHRAELYGRRAELRKRQKHYEAAIQDLDTFLDRSSQPFDHPDVRRAWNLRRECEEALRTARAQ
jgi:tetratricopeptide (TPR) repeat protein